MHLRSQRLFKFVSRPALQAHCKPQGLTYGLMDSYSLSLLQGGQLKLNMRMSIELLPRYFHVYQKGLQTGTRVPIATKIHFEKYWYHTASLRTGTKRHRFVSANKASCYLSRTANMMKHRVLISAVGIPDSVKNPHCLELLRREIQYDTGLEIKIFSREPNCIFISFIKVFCMSNSTYLGFWAPCRNLREPQEHSREPSAPVTP